MQKKPVQTERFAGLNAMNGAFKNRVGRVAREGKTDFLACDVPLPQADEVVVRVRASALCGSDLHIFQGKHPSVPPPATIGHEFSGDVAAVGSDVRGLSPGARVTVEPCVTCGVCEACQHGEYGSCERITFLYRQGNGAMADYVTAKAARVFRLPDSMSYETGALIEPLAVAVHAVRRAGVRMGERVAVLGGGAIGLLVAALSKRVGAAEVIVSDPSPFRRDMAKSFGATRTANPREEGDVEKAVLESTDGKGMDKTFECVGRQETLAQSMTLLRKNGLATVVGIFEQPQASIPITRLVSHEIRLQGTQGYCWDFPTALQMAGEIFPERLITHRFPLEDLQVALETSLDQSQNALKVLLKP